MQRQNWYTCYVWEPYQKLTSQKWDRLSSQEYIFLLLGGGLLVLLPVAWLLVSGEPLGIDSTFGMVREGVGLFAGGFLVFTAFVGLIGLVKRAALYLEMARSAFPKESNFLQSIFAQ